MDIIVVWGLLASFSSCRSYISVTQTSEKAVSNELQEVITSARYSFAVELLEVLNTRPKFGSQFFGV